MLHRLRHCARHAAAMRGPGPRAWGPPRVCVAAVLLPPGGPCGRARSWSSDVPAGEPPASEGGRRERKKELYMVFTCGRCNTRAVKGFSRQAYEHGVHPSCGAETRNHSACGGGVV